jgi:hypothetical protein
MACWYGVLAGPPGARRAMRLLSGIILALFFVWPSPSRGQNSPESEATLAGIGGVVVYVDTLSSDMPQRGMTREVLRLKVVRRLRDAGVPVVDVPIQGRIPGDPMLILGITTLFDELNRKCVCSLRLEFAQTVRLDRNPGYVVFGVSTWSVGYVGLYTKRWREELIEDVYSLTDEFVDAYYRANPVPEG